MNTLATEAKLQPTVTDMLPDINGMWREYKAKRIKQFPQNNLRASSIGWPCDRFHYHAIKDWREKPLHDAIMQSIFDEGHLHEIDILRQLTEMGIEVVEQQRAFQIDKPLITGTIDGILRWKGAAYPFDAKSISPYEFDRIESAEDLLFSKKIYQRQYPAQLQMYLLMYSQEIGLFILKNKVTGELKPIWMQIDYAYAEEQLKRAERVYVALKAGEPPARVNDFSICSGCAFRAVCLPDVLMGPGVIPIDDPELSGMLERREVLQPLAKEFETIDKEVKAAVTRGGAGEKLCGDFLIRVAEHTRTTKVALTWEEEQTNYFRTQILRVHAAPPAQPVETGAS